MRHEEVREHVDYVCGLQLASHTDGQALVSELVDHVQHPELAPVVRSLLHEVVRPDVVRVFWSEADAGAVSQPEPPLLGLLMRHLQALASPDPLHSLGVHNPARGPEQSGDLAVAIAPVLACERDDVGRQRLFVVSAPRHLAARVERC